MQVVPRLFTVTSAGSSEPPALPLTSPPPEHAVLTSSPSAHFNSPNINYENQKAGADGSVRASHGSGLLEALLAKSSPKPRTQSPEAKGTGTRGLYKLEQNYPTHLG